LLVRRQVSRLAAHGIRLDGLATRRLHDDYEPSKYLQFDTYEAHA